ncbi:MAG: methyltransferase domain-containing protein, partial [Nitrososphaeraceae archaeon]
MGDIVRGSTLNRVDKALHMINHEGLGLEIGPSHNPIAPKKSGFNIEILDHATAEELRKKYKDHPVHTENIEAVDYVWRGEPLNELIGKQDTYDYIIASHVIEHITDLVSFLVQCESLLKYDGVLSLIIPDKRYCFDYFRWPSSTGEVLQAYTEKRTRHSPGTVFDHFSNVVRMGGARAWTKETVVGEFSYFHNLEQAKQLWQRAQVNDDYIDVHGWCFTPSSFRLILHDLNSLGLTRLIEVCGFETVGCEFYITLGKSKVPRVAVDRLQLAQDAMKELLNGFKVTKATSESTKALVIKHKVLFVHVAKAAGSSINSYFKKHYTADKCIVHIESQKNVLIDKASLEDKDFISGHITYREFKTRLDMEKFFTITCLREPVAHIVSHLAWIRKLAEPSEKRRFEAHPAYIQKLASKMIGVDFRSPMAVQALIKNLEPAERYLLDNAQVNYLHECHPLRLVGQAELESALTVIDKFNLIGVLEYMDLFFRLLSDRLGISSECYALHENIQTDKYGM